MLIGKLGGVLLTLLLVASVDASTPRFENYPSTTASRPHHTAKISLANPRTRMFRTRIRLAAEDGPNFAGSFTIAEWGCGTDCLGIAIVDNRTGRVYHDPLVAELGGCMNQAQERLEYRADSRLVIVRGEVLDARGDDRTGIFYFAWDGVTLRQVRFEPHSCEDFDGATAPKPSQ